MKQKLCLVILFLFSFSAQAQTSSVPLQKVKIDATDSASLQRGAKYYVNYCQGCHSIRYMRYEQMADGIDLKNDKGKILKKLLEDNLIFTQAKPSDPMLSAMPAQAENWFGILPPDLSLKVRERGADWVYTFLHSFYFDAKRPLGSNNALLPAAAMPNVLENLQGTQLPVYVSKIEVQEGQKVTVSELHELKLVKLGQLSPKEFDQMTQDLVNFLSFVSEPMKTYSHRLGFCVLIFLLLFSIIAYLLKKSYWKDIH